MRTYKIYSLSSFQIHNAVLLTTVTMLYVPRTDWLLNENFVPSDHLHPFHPFPSAYITPTSNHRLLSACMSFYFYLDSTYKVRSYGTSLYLTGIMPSRSIEVVISGRIFFLCLNITLCVCMCVCDISFIHLSINGPLDCFHVLAIVSNSAVNVET